MLLKKNFDPPTTVISIWCFKLIRKESAESVFPQKNGLELKDYVTEDVVKTGKPCEYKLTNNYTVMGKTIFFVRHDSKVHTTTGSVTGQIEYQEYMHIQVTIIGTSPKQESNFLLFMLTRAPC